MREERDHEIRPASVEDMPLLEHVLGRERAWFCRDRLDRPGVVLTLWTAGELGGTLFINFGPADEAVIQRHLPAVPFLHRLHVRSHLRRRGLGWALVAEAERRLSRLSVGQVGAGVDPKDADLIAWYERHGFREWKHGPVDTVRERYDDRGALVTEDEVCAVFLKDIAR